MAYDLLIKNARIIDGSGSPSFEGSVAVKDGVIHGVGKVSGAPIGSSTPKGWRSPRGSSTTIATTTPR